MGRRTLLLLVAIAVAAVGTGLVFVYVSNADDRALKNQEPVEVLVAKTLIRAGTLGSEAEKAGALTLQRIPRAATIEGALSDPRPINALVAVGDIYPGEQIIRAKFGQSGETSVLPIPEGEMAISVQMGDPERVAGFVRPGSDVAVIITITPQGARNGEQTRVLLPRMTVLAVGPTTLKTAPGAQANKEALPTAILTLAASQREAQKLIFGSQHGDLYFTLVNEESEIGPGAPVDIANLFS
jgi:pilus assembly protein CpaB